MLDNLTIEGFAMEKRHIGYAVKSLNRSIDRAINAIPEIRNNNTLTGIQVWILSFLFRNEGKDVFQRDIESEFKIRRSTATQLLKAMETGGLIQREGVSYDARLKKILLTEYAEEIRKQIQVQIDRTEKQMMNGFLPEEIDKFFEFVARFKENIAKIQ